MVTLKNQYQATTNTAKSLEEQKNMTHSYPNWFDKNKFKNSLAIVDSSKFGCKNKTGEFKYIDIKDLVSNIKNNTISEISTKKDLNSLNQLKNIGKTKQKNTFLNRSNY